MIETQVLTSERGTYRLMQPFPSIRVLATVQAVLAARIDQLPAQENRLLQAAAVIGTNVHFLLLQAIAELPEEALRGTLTHLQAAEFIYETRLFPELEYTFKHPLHPSGRLRKPHAGAAAQPARQDRGDHRGTLL